MVDREMMLDAAERVIARDGNGASLDAIAIEAGVTKPVVYARVGSRGDLSNALAARLTERLISASSGEIGSSRLDQVSLAAFFRTTLETFGAHRELFLYVTGGSAEDKAERMLYLAHKSATPLAELLARVRHRHGQDPAVSTTWAYAIVGMLNLTSLWWIDDGSRSIDELADQLAALVWRGVNAPD